MTASGATEARRPLGSFVAPEGNNFEMFFTMADTNLQPTKLRQDAGERFGVVNVAGDGNCLFHACFMLWVFMTVKMVGPCG